MRSERALAAAADLSLARAGGLPLAHFRPEHVSDQVARACAREGAGDAGSLARMLARDPVARTRFRRSVAISYGAMFRDPEQFRLLEQVLLPRLLEDGRRLAAWSAGCADGSELYTLGIVLERMGALERALLLGSDLLEENIAAARAGRYEGHDISPEVRERVRWERRDIVDDGPPAGRWRLVMCRNVAIYLGPAARRRLYEALVSALATRGVLLLGRSERLLDAASLGLRPVAPHAYERVH
ncbi:CheR family methyltransferase [Candidatus Solirubrobacter pratensis]|uniref:CheR family methyltransferase n=1 Tax=Candidatus Solirubrobacter pratensis TaxID=1298857 RepID=UPI0003F6D56C|nr:CheR family methyltransferase [Candidatus Solirubrobacter pratensis]